MNTVSEGIISFLPSLVVSAARLLGAFGILLYYDPVMALIALMGVPVTLIFSRVLLRKMRQHNLEIKELTGRCSLCERIDTVMEVLCEGYDDENDCYFGRTYMDSPDIDGRVLFTAERTVRVGSFVNVVVTDVRDGDLIAEEVEE